MKNNLLIVLTLGAGLALAATGCSHKTDANSELEKAASEISKTEPTPPPAIEQAAQTAQATPAPTEPSAPPAQQMNQAMAAYKAGQLEDAVTRLHKLRSSGVMSPQQTIALNTAMGAVMTEVYALAAKGDGRAIQAVKQYEQMQTQPH